VAVAALVSVLVVALRGAGRPAGAAQAPGTPVTLDPSQRLPTEAAVRNGWTLIAHDEFDGDTLDEDHWSAYRGRTTDDVGQHDPDNLSVADGTLKLTSRGNTSAGLAWNDGQRYGRWEARVRSERGNGYGPVMLLWPDAEDWPEGGEIDIMEIPRGDRTTAHFTVHWADENTQGGTSAQADFTQWHIFAVEWTPDHIVGYLDGNEIYQRRPRREPAALDAPRHAAGHRPLRRRLDPGPRRHHAADVHVRGRLGADLRRLSRPCPREMRPSRQNIAGPAGRRGPRCSRTDAPLPPRSDEMRLA